MVAVRFRVGAVFFVGVAALRVEAAFFVADDLRVEAVFFVAVDALRVAAVRLPAVPGRLVALAVAPRGVVGDAALPTGGGACSTF